MSANSQFLTVFLTLLPLNMAGCGDGNRPAPASPQPPATTAAAGASSETEPAAERFSALPSPYDKADYSLGRRTFKLCGSCHTLVEGGQNLVGPNLHGIIGREAGSLESYEYSSTLEDASFAWTPELLEEWLANPKTFLPGNNMTFAGVRRPADRHAVIAYLMLESGYPPPAGNASESEPPLAD